MTDFPENNIDKQPQEEEFSTVFAAPVEHKKKAEAGKKKKPLLIVLSCLLAVSVLVGGTIAVIKLIPEREEEENTPSITDIEVLNKKSDDLSSIKVTNKNGKFSFYSEKTKAEGSDTETVSWYLEGYDKSLLNPSKASAVASSAANISASREITEKTAEDCGLLNPEITVTVKEGEQEFSILLGSESLDNSGCYLKLSNSDKIYLVDSSIKSSFLFDELQFANTDNLPAMPTDSSMSDYLTEDGTLAKFDKLIISGKSFKESLVIENNTNEAYSSVVPFMITSPFTRLADNLDDVFTAFQSGIAVTGAYSYDTSPASVNKFGLNNPDFSVTMQIKNKTHTYKLKLQSDGNYAALCDGVKLIKKVSASTVPYAQFEAKDFYWKLVSTVSLDTLSGYTFKTPEKTYEFKLDTANEDSEKWSIECNGKKINTEAFQDFYQLFVGLTSSDYAVSDLNSAPDYYVEYTFREGNKKSSVEFLKASETRYQYNVDGIPMGKVTSSDLKKLSREIEKLMK